MQHELHWLPVSLRKQVNSTGKPNLFLFTLTDLGRRFCTDLLVLDVGLVNSDEASEGIPNV